MQITLCSAHSLEAGRYAARIFVFRARTSERDQLLELVSSRKVCPQNVWEFRLCRLLSPLGDTTAPWWLVGSVINPPTVDPWLVLLVNNVPPTVGFIFCSVCQPRRNPIGQDIGRRQACTQLLHSALKRFFTADLGGVSRRSDGAPGILGLGLSQSSSCRSWRHVAPTLMGRCGRCLGR